MTAEWFVLRVVQMVLMVGAAGWLGWLAFVTLRSRLRPRPERDLVPRRPLDERRRWRR